MVFLQGHGLEPDAYRFVSYCTKQYTKRFLFGLPVSYYTYSIIQGWTLALWFFLGVGGGGYRVLTSGNDNVKSLSFGRR